MAMHAVDVRSASGMVHRLILRRWTRPGWREEGPDDPAQEVRTLEALRAAPFPVPRVVAADVEGRETDVPTLLLERLPGRAPRHAATRRRSSLGVLARVADEAVAAFAAAGESQLDQPWWAIRSVLDVSHAEWGGRLGTGAGLARVERYLAHVVATWEALGDGR